MQQQPLKNTLPWLLMFTLAMGCSGMDNTALHLRDSGGGGHVSRQEEIFLRSTTNGVPQEEAQRFYEASLELFNYAHAKRRAQKAQGLPSAEQMATEAMRNTQAIPEDLKKEVVASTAEEMEEKKTKWLTSFHTTLVKDFTRLGVVGEEGTKLIEAVHEACVQYVEAWVQNHQRAAAARRTHKSRVRTIFKRLSRRS